MKLSACEQLAIHPIHSKWYRAIRPEYWKAALGTAHTARTRSRFSPGTDSVPRFEILYLAENPSAALYEVRAQYGPPQRPLVNPFQSKWGIIDVDVRMNAIADLTDPFQQKRLGTSAQELTGDWRDLYPANNAPTQRLGTALFASKHIEGFFAISATMPLCRTLIIFPQKLQQGSELVFSDTITGKTHRIGPPDP